MRSSLHRFFSAQPPKLDVTACSSARNLILISLDWTRPKDPPLSLGHASVLANLCDKKIPVIERSYLHENKHKLELVESSDIQIDEIPRIQHGIPHVVASNSFTFLEWQKMAAIAASLDQYNQEMAHQRSLSERAASLLI